MIANYDMMNEGIFSYLGNKWKRFKNIFKRKKKIQPVQQKNVSQSASHNKNSTLHDDLKSFRDSYNKFINTKIPKHDPNHANEMLAKKKKDDAKKEQEHKDMRWKRFKDEYAAAVESDKRVMNTPEYKRTKGIVTRSKMLLRGGK